MLYYLCTIMIYSRTKFFMPFGDICCSTSYQFVLFFFQPTGSFLFEFVLFIVMDVVCGCDMKLFSVGIAFNLLVTMEIVTFLGHLYPALHIPTDSMLLVSIPRFSFHRSNSSICLLFSFTVVPPNSLASTLS